VNYTAAKPREAQQICNELTALLVNENLKSVQAAAKGTTDVLSKGIEDAKRNLDDMDSKLADFNGITWDSFRETETTTSRY